ncbi:hypothetical protein HYV43_05290 [Candidatus Micrarchaeota archaeon]|nr:hypothetical protein [Candidatus Micrarchaeota archaeon]
MHEILHAFANDPRSKNKYGVKRVQAIVRVRDAAQLERSRNPFTRFFNTVKEIEGEGARMEMFPSEPAKWRAFKSDFAKVGTVAIARHILAEEADAIWEEHGIPKMDNPHEIGKMSPEKLNPIVQAALTKLSARHQYDRHYLLAILWSQTKEGRAK